MKSLLTESSAAASRHNWLATALRTTAIACALVVLMLFVPASAFAQPLAPSVYQPQGAPANPKVAAHWNRYHDYTQSTRLLAQLAKAYPKLARLQSLGKSYGDREMWVLTITNSAVGKENEKPAMWIDGAIHANEIQATEVVLYTAWYLLEGYDTNPTIKRLLDQRVFYLMPMMSPDSRDAHMYKPNSTHSPRSGQRPLDDDKDGLVDEDGPDDLDGDGEITEMRIRDPNGRWKVDKDYPELMIRCKPGERGQYTLLGSEGIDNDGDGLVNEDGDGYYDPNRDWPWNWQPTHIQSGAYRYPFSILENRMVADFISAHPNIAGGQSYHNAAGMILRGPGASDDKIERADLALYDVIGKQGETIIPGYRYSEIAKDLYTVYGGEIDWLYNMRGVFAFTNELNTPYNLFHRKDDRSWFGNESQLFEFNKLLLFEGGVVPWHEYQHPAYGKIEIGGMKKNWVRQPPSFLLEEECHRNMAFSLYHADQLPLVRVQSIAVKDLGGGLNEVTAVIANESLLPTHAAVDLKNKITPPDLASISAEKITVVTGLVSRTPFFQPIDSKEQKRKPAALKLESVPGMGARYVRWIVSGTGPFTVTIRSVKGGVHQLKK